jgi:hypothetical protein
MISSGIIWTDCGLPHVCLGDGDVWALVTGSFFEFCLDFCATEEDDETKKLLWEKLRDDIVREHIKYIPTTRPWAWWRFDSTEPRRVLGLDHDPDESNGHDSDDLPAVVEDPKELYFGLPSHYDGYVYETERDYLKRLDLLTDSEKQIFAKYGDICLVRAAVGAHRECAHCWEEAEKIGAKMDFDLKAAIIEHGEFWIPRECVFPCPHDELFKTGIFDEQ